MSEVARRSTSRKTPVARRGQRGFTLIEMSIVLTIIGLIVGGILKGQELINNARIKSQVAQIDNIKSAVLTFQDRYSYLPGDYPTAGSFGFTSGSTTNGNADGAIDAGNTSTPYIADNVTVVNTESEMVWPELTAANLLAGYITTAASPLLSATTANTADYLPGKISGTYLWLGTFQTSVPTAANANTNATQINLAVRLQGQNQGAAPTSGIKGLDMFGIDTKYDDGLPYSGSIIVTANSTTTNCVTAQNATGTYNSAPTGADLGCIPLFGVQ